MDKHKTWATTIATPKSVGSSTTKEKIKPAFRVSLMASQADIPRPIIFCCFTHIKEHLNFTTILRGPDFCISVKSSKHISLQTFLSSRFSTLWSLLSIAQQIKQGWDFTGYCDTTFNLSLYGTHNTEAHHFGSMMGDDSETKLNYK